MSAIERKVDEFGVTQKRILLFILALVAFFVVEQNTGRIIDATKLNLKFNEIDLREDIPEDTVYHHKNGQRPAVKTTAARGELKVKYLNKFQFFNSFRRSSPKSMRPRKKSKKHKTCVSEIFI